MGRDTAQRNSHGALTLWSYAESVWRRPQVEAACLALQETYGQSPPLLLWRLWAVSEGRSLDVPTIENAVAAARRWESNVVRPLRDIRHRLKGDLPIVSRSARVKFADSLRAAELDAEHLLLDALEALASEGMGRGADGLSALLELAAIWGAAAPIAALRRLLTAVE